jgi:hypothetical protein
MPYGTHPYVFNALTFALPQDIDYLSNLLWNQQTIAQFELKAHRRRGAWSSTVPPGVFDNLFQANACSWDQHTASRDRITTLAAADMPHQRRPIARSHDVLEHDGSLYYHPEALRVYARYVDHGAFLRALAAFLEAAERNTALIAPRRSRTPYVPREWRGPVRGPSWEPAEDLVLRRWFGPRSVGDRVGKHQRLTPEEWDIVLRELPRRNKKAVHDRIVELNKPLLREFLRDGFVARDHLAQYMTRVLGERPRVPIRPTPRRRSRRALTL